MSSTPRAPYKAKTLSGATRRVRDLECRLAEALRMAKVLRNQRNVMARLAAEKPQFFNPIEAIEAKRLRDAILGNIPGANL